MSKLGTFKNYKHKISIGEVIYVVAGSNITNAQTLPDVLGDFVRCNTYLSKTTYSDLYNEVKNSLLLSPGTSKSSMLPHLAHGTIGQIESIAYGNNTYVAVSTGQIYYYQGNNPETGSWSSGSNIPNVYISDITYGNGKFVAVGDRNYIATSTNGITWTSSSFSHNNTTLSYRSITYGNSIFAAGSVNGLVYTSTDGITWTSRTTGTSSSIRSIIYANNQYLIGGHTGLLATSTDASTWTIRSSGTTSTIMCLAYGNNLYLYGSTNGGLSTSTDAITWTARTLGSTETTSGIAYGNGLYLRVSYGSGGNEPYYYSTDGTTWYKDNGYWYNRHTVLKYLNGRFIHGSQYSCVFTNNNSLDDTFCVTLQSNFKVASDRNYPGYSLEPYIKYVNSSYSDLPVGTVLDETFSSNNLTGNSDYLLMPGIYSQSAYPELFQRVGLINASPFKPFGGTSTGSSINDITYGAGTYVIGGNTGFIATSTDLNIWTTRTSNTSSNISALAYGNGRYVYVLNNSGSVGTSTDAITWTVAASDTATNTRAVIYENGLFIKSGDSGTLASSTDAITWTTRNSNTGAMIDTLSYSNGLYVYRQSTPGFGTAQFILGTSTDGINWKTRFNYNSGTTSSIYVIKYLNLRYIYAGSNGVLNTSDTGIDWVSVSSGTTSTINAIAYGNGTYVYVGTGGATGTSTDSITWTAQTSGTTSNITSIEYGNGIFIQGGAGALLRTSTDGITWTVRDGNTLAGAQVNSIIYGNNTFVLGCSDGKIRTSTDGITWTIVTSPVVSLTAGVGVYSPNTQRYYFGNATNIVVSGINNPASWEVITTSFGNNISGMSVYSNQVMVSMSGGGLVGLSENGYDFWPVYPLGTTFTANCCLATNGLYFLAGSNAVMYYSTDGRTWRPIYGITHGKQKFRTILGGMYATSTNAISWSYNTTTVPNMNVRLQFMHTCDDSVIYAHYIEESKYSISKNDIDIYVRIFNEYLGTSTAPKYKFKYLNNQYISMEAPGTGISMRAKTSTDALTIKYSEWYDVSKHFMLPKVDSSSLKTTNFYVKAKP